MSGAVPDKHSRPGAPIVEFRRGGGRARRDGDIFSHDEVRGRQAEHARADLMAGGIMDIRGPCAEDIPYITRSWLKSYEGAHAVHYMTHDVYFQNHHAILEALWADPGVTWLVGCWAKNPAYILGFLCAEATDRGPIVHYVYVQSGLFQLGIGRQLYEAFAKGLPPHPQTYFTHATGKGLAALSGRMAATSDAPGWVYNPYLLYKKLG